MLDKIKEAVFKKYKKDEIKGIFFSIFDEKNGLLLSNGVFYTEKPLEELINTIYHGLIEKYNNISNIVIDIILESEEINSSEEMKNISIKDFGIVLTDENKSGVLLPDTKGINNIQEGLKAIKEKNNLSGNVKITKFKTDRFSIN